MINLYNQSIVNMPCPLCRANARISTSGGQDERSGYNYEVTIRCQECGCSVAEGSEKDDLGWANDDPQKIALRCIAKWERRDG